MPVVLFDGVCNLCNRTVQFILRHDRQAHFRFAAQQSEAGQQLLARHGLASSGLAESVVILEEGRVWRNSDAVFYILWRLGGFWRILTVFWLLPRPLRDGLYRVVARHRYRIFGRLPACLVPTPELRERFLDRP